MGWRGETERHNDGRQGDAEDIQDRQDRQTGEEADRTIDVEEDIQAGGGNQVDMRQIGGRERERRVERQVERHTDEEAGMQTDKRRDRRREVQVE